MDREPVVGECVVVRRNSGGHGLRLGECLVVSHVDDDDSTLRGTPSGTRTVRDAIDAVYVHRVQPDPDRQAVRTALRSVGLGTDTTTADGAC